MAARLFITSALSTKPASRGAQGELLTCGARCAWHQPLSHGAHSHAPKVGSFLLGFTGGSGTWAKAQRQGGFFAAGRGLCLPATRTGQPPPGAVPGARTPTGATSSGQRLMTTLSLESAAAEGAAVHLWRRDAWGLRPTGKLCTRRQGQASRVSVGAFQVGQGVRRHGDATRQAREAGQGGCPGGRWTLKRQQPPQV